MNAADTPPDTVAFLRGIASELAEIHRARDYAEWRSEAKHRSDNYLSRAAPFCEFANAWVFMGDGASSLVGGSFGDWVIDRLVEKMAPERAVIFDEMKHLYKARSEAVHSGVFSPKAKIDLDLADQLVVRVMHAILERASFPDWASLTMGGEG